MPEPDAVRSFPGADPAKLAAAISAALLHRADLAERLREGAVGSVSETPTESETARRFQTFLELGYLVASADGFADEERDSLASLLEAVTQKAIDHDVLDLHFRDLDEGVTLLGRSQRLARSAAELEDDAAAEEAIALVAMIALADGTLATREYEAIETLGKHTGISSERVRAVVDEAAKEIAEGLR